MFSFVFSKDKHCMMMYDRKNKSFFKNIFIYSLAQVKKWDIIFDT